MQIILFLIPLLFFVAYAALLIYYRMSWLSIPGFKTPAPDYIPATKISVIIPARNEEDNIAACLHSMIAQNYPAELFEIIVVDDHSTDHTAAIVQSMQAKNSKLISLQDFTNNRIINSYKKKAIEIAIQQATGDLIITTDADCMADKNWIRTIAAFYEKTNAAFIAAPVTYKPEPGFIKIFQSLDFMTLQGITGASVYKKIHSMCNGANLAYEKKVFHEVGGFKNIDSIASGDDMLLMHKIFLVYPERVQFLKSDSAVIETTAMDSFKQFLQQRIRWASKADKYDDKRIFAVLLTVYLFNCLLLLLPVLAIFKNVHFAFYILHFTLIKYWLLLVVAKTIIELIFLYPVALFFNKQKQLWWFPVAQPFHILYTVVAGWLGKFGSYQWKGRRVK